VANAKVERIVGTSSLLPLGAGDVKYYDFSQNNSGGRFHVDDNVAENVIIAARTVDEANERAEKVGIYFDGCAAAGIETVATRRRQGLRLLRRSLVFSVERIQGCRAARRRLST